MKKIYDLTGKKFGKLTVIKISKDSQQSQTKWLCQCDCGNFVDVFASNLKRGHTTSCGCYSLKEKSDRRNDLVGKRFGRLLVLEYIESSRRESPRKQYLCKCDCGNNLYARGDSLMKGATKSCGCYQKEYYKSGRYRTHNMSKSRLYGIWHGMKARCSNPKNQRYSCYGGRGIEVCSEWESNFEVFKDWALKNGYQDGLSIDRIDVDGNYEPSNCRWITLSEQSDNKRDSRRIEYKGKMYTSKELSRMFGIPYSTIYQSAVVRGNDFENFLNNYTPRK